MDSRQSRIADTLAIFAALEPFKREHPQDAVVSMLITAASVYLAVFIDELSPDEGGKESALMMSEALDSWTARIKRLKAERKAKS